jgi:type II secretion system protein I
MTQRKGIAMGGANNGDRPIFWRRARMRRLNQKNGPVPFRHGFTLLEIILALAILAGSLAALGEVMRLADQNATMTRDESQAQILAATVMDELVAGARQLMAMDRGQFEIVSEPRWLYSIAIEQTAYDELIAVRVLVEQDLDPRLQPARFQLVRWLPNPDYIPADASSGSTTSTSTGSSTTGGSGGTQSGSGGQR